MDEEEVCALHTGKHMRSVCAFKRYATISYMRALIFFLAILAVVFYIFSLTGRELDFDANDPYCKELSEKMQNEEGYSLSYGERVKAVWKGCF